MYLLKIKNLAETLYFDYHLYNKYIKTMLYAIKQMRYGLEGKL